MAQALINVSMVTGEIAEAVETAQRLFYADATATVQSNAARRALAKIAKEVLNAPQEAGHFWAVIDGRKVCCDEVRAALITDLETEAAEVKAVHGYITSTLYGYNTGKGKDREFHPGIADLLGIDSETAEDFAKAGTSRRASIVRDIMPKFGIENLKTALYKGEADRIVTAIGRRQASVKDIMAGERYTTATTAKATQRLLLMAFTDVLADGGLGHRRSERDTCVKFFVSDSGTVSLNFTEAEQADRKTWPSETLWAALKAETVKAIEAKAREKAEAEKATEEAKENAAAQKAREKELANARRAVSEAKRRNNLAQDNARKADAEAEAYRVTAENAAKSAAALGTITAQNDATLRAAEAKDAVNKAAEANKKARQAAEKLTAAEKRLAEAEKAVGMVGGLEPDNDTTAA